MGAREGGGKAESSAAASVLGGQCSATKWRRRGGKQAGQREAGAGAGGGETQITEAPSRREWRRRARCALNTASAGQNGGGPPVT